MCDYTSHRAASGIFPFPSHDQTIELPFQLHVNQQGDGSSTYLTSWDGQITWPERTFNLSDVRDPEVGTSFLIGKCSCVLSVLNFPLN